LVGFIKRVMSRVCWRVAVVARRGAYVGEWLWLLEEGYTREGLEEEGGKRELDCNNTCAP
jgi:hypothetical protein